MARYATSLSAVRDATADPISADIRRIRSGQKSVERDGRREGGSGTVSDHYVRTEIRMRALLVILVATLATPVSAEICGDIDGNGAVTVTDGVLALRLAAGLPVDGACGAPVSTATPHVTPTPMPTPITDSLVDMLGVWQFTTENVDFQALRQYHLTTVAVEDGILTVRGTDQDGDPVRVRHTSGTADGLVLEHSYCRTQSFAHTIGTDSIYGGRTYFGHPEDGLCAFTQVRNMTGVRISR